MSPRLAARYEHGFTLIEIVISLGVAAALAALLGVAVSRALQSVKETQTQQQVQQTFNAIVGSNPAQGNFGFLGDMGRLPATLTELVTQGAQVAYHTTGNIGNVGTGWRGPYLTAPYATIDIFKDSWGQSLTYTNTGISAGQIVSGGADGADGVVGNADDADNIIFPVQLPVKTTGTLNVTVVVNTIAQPTGLSVSVYSTSDGNQGTAVTQTRAAAGPVPFMFTVPHGVTVIVATHTAGTITVTRTVTVQVAAGTQIATTIQMSTSATVTM
ncbi:MAG: type II secretion system protein GspG [Acidobacteriota bacterium]|nr:type II secretion system protein GspG [Acidobacteriota bacterium]